jgi:hypothetical protein
MIAEMTGDDYGGAGRAGHVFSCGYGHGILQAAFQLAAYGCGFPLAAYRLSYSHHCKRVIIIT